ncbi:MAG: DUF2341 domain-containing protein [Kiritimatiellae bacterium]|nr:DUF2341 domain-containing protein [Kiritimatiellia bacterium]
MKKNNRSLSGDRLLRLSLLAFAGLAASMLSAAEMTYSFSWYAGPTVANFQAPITLREGVNGFSYSGFASADGSDLRIKDSGGNLLPYEIERWNTSSYSLVWVKVPSLSASTALTLSWGDASAPNSTVANIWDNAYHVFHLGDAPRKDSSINNLQIPATQTPDAVVAPEGVGASFSGDRGIGKKNLQTSSYPNTAVPSTDGATAASFTISFWFKADDFTTANSYLWYINGGEQVAVIYNYNTKLVELFNLGGTIRSLSAINVPDLRWHHYAYTYDAANLIFRSYLDGALVKSESSITAVFPKWTRSANGGIFDIGSGWGSGAVVNGSIDEFRFEPDARSQNWIKACFAVASASYVLDAAYEYDLAVPEYDRNTALEDYPLMVTLHEDMPGLSDNMKAVIRKPGNFKFFTSDGQTELEYERENHPTDVGAATYWVKVPLLAKGGGIRICGTMWPFLRSDMTWDSSYYHVWHLASTLYRYDSASSYPCHLATDNYFTNYAAAVSGPSGHYGALQCGSQMATYAETSNDPRGLTNRYTVSFWARKRAEDFANPRESYVMQMRQASTSSQLAVLTGFHGNGNTFKLWGWTSAGGSVNSPLVPIPDSGWHHYAFTCDGSATRGYLDGVEVVSGSAFNFNLPAITDKWRFTMGGERWAPSANSFYGDLDEFRIELEPRSADWIYANYRTQRGLVDGVVCSAKPAFGTERSVAAAGVDSLGFKANLVCRVPTEVTFYYGVTYYADAADAWSSNSVPLGTVEGGLLEASVGSLSPDQCVVGRFYAMNAYGEAWSEVLSGRAGAKPCERYARIVVTNYTGAALEDFPLCVKLPASVELPAESTGLRFLDAEGKSLAFEIEKWDPSGESVFWVRVPSLVNGTKIRAVWDNVFAAHGSVHAQTVWSDDFKAVYHLASVQDSSPSGRHFTTDTLSMAADGIVGGARSFTGVTGKHMCRPDNNLLPDISGAFSISGWVKPDDSCGQSYLLQFHNGTYQFAVLYNFDAPRMLNLFSYPNINCYTSNGNDQQNADLRNFATPMTIPDDGGWHHFAYTYDQEAFSVYLDGELVRSVKRNYSLGSGYPALQKYNLELGQNWGPGAQYKGQVDELRFESVRRSADWVKACYLNQKGALVSVRVVYPGMMILR